MAVSLYFVLLLLAFVPAVRALVDIARRRQMPEPVRLGLPAAITFAPFLGALASWIIRPGRPAA